MMLTPRQLDILEAIAAGVSTKEIAAARWNSAATIKSHVRNILTRLNARNRAHAVSIAYTHGLLPLPPRD